MADNSLDIEEYLDFIKSVPEVADTFLELLRTHWSGWVILIGIVIWVLLNKKTKELFSILEKRKNDRVESFEKYLVGKDFVDPDVALIVKDQHAAFIFEKATGIIAENKRRNNLIRLHELLSYTVSWKQIKRAIGYLEFDRDGAARIRDFKWSDKLAYGYNIFVGIFFLLFSGIVFIALVIPEPRTVANVFVGFGITSGLAVFSMYVFSLNWPMNAARKIKEMLIEVSNQ